MTRAFSVWVCCAVLALAGCYTYVPATLEDAPVGSRVRALLTPDSQERLRLRHGFEGSSLEGRLEAREGDRLQLFVPSVRRSAELGSQVLYQQVDIMRGDVLRVDVRQVDSFRTAALVVVGAAVTGVVVHATVSGIAGGGSSDGGNGQIESIRGWLILLPLLRW